MPCTPDQACIGINGSDPNTYSQGNINPDPTTMYANMGWVGYAKLILPTLQAKHTLRVTSANINLQQDITMPDVIDGRIGKTVYVLGPRITQGTISMPVIADLETGGCPTVNDLRGTTGAAGSLLNDVWCWATSRGQQGRMLHTGSMEIRYANHAAFTFDTCLANTLSMKVAQSEQVTFDIELWGRGRTPFNDPLTQPPASNFLSPARALTWNDITINGIAGCNNGGDLFFSNQVRTFTLDINNHAERFYSLNGSLTPIDLNVGKREITGTMELLGRANKLAQLAETNQNRFTEKNELRIAAYIGDDRFQNGAFISRDWTGSTAVPATAIFGKRLTGVVFKIEEMQLTNSVFVTTVGFNALANDEEGYMEFSPSGSCSFPAWGIV